MDILPDYQRMPLPLECSGDEVKPLRVTTDEHVGKSSREVNGKEVDRRYGHEATDFLEEDGFGANTLDDEGGDLVEVG